MTRTAARELAVLISAASAPGTAAETAETFFEPEHYASLASEGEQFAAVPDGPQMAYIRALVTDVDAHREELDGYIRRHSRGWRPERLSRTAAAILRCALCESLYVPDVDTAAAINEAVELAKKYEGRETAGFINGVLGGFARAGEEAAHDSAAAETEP